MGQLPGDLPKRYKIKMIETGVLDLGYHPWYNPSKSFQDKVKKKAQKRFRRDEKKQVQDSMGS